MATSIPKIIVCTRIRLDPNTEVLDPDDRGFLQECYSWQDDDMFTGNFLLLLFESKLFIQTVHGFLAKYKDQLLESFPEDKAYLGPKGWGDQSYRIFLQGYAAGIYKFIDVHDFLIADPEEEYYRTIHIIPLNHSDGSLVVKPKGLTKETATAVRVKFGQATVLGSKKVSAMDHSTTIPDGDDPSVHNVDRYGKKLNLPI